MGLIWNEIFRAGKYLLIACIVAYAWKLARDNAKDGKLVNVLWKGLLWCAGIALFTSLTLGNPTCVAQSDPVYGGCDQYAEDGYEASTKQRAANFAYFMTLLYVPVVFGAFSGNKIKSDESLSVTETVQKSTPSKKILHFEDERMLRDMYGTKFQMLGFEFAGYESPTKNPVKLVLKEKPDLIIMDIIMPVMDGYTATKILKDDKRTAQIPIVGLCNMGQKEDIQKALDLGMADYLVTAEHMPNDVVERVKKILKL